MCQYIFLENMVMGAFFYFADTNLLNGRSYPLTRRAPGRGKNPIESFQKVLQGHVLQLFMGEMYSVQ